MEEFDKVWPALRVLARSSPDDKYLSKKNSNYLHTLTFFFF